MKLIECCAACGKPLEVNWLDSLREYYVCGHSSPRETKKVAKQVLDFKGLDGEIEAYPYQQFGVEFIVNSGFNCLIGDDMGLGKTAQSLLAVWNYKEDCLPCLIVQKSATTGNWIKEIQMWCSKDPYIALPIFGKLPLIMPGFKFYIFSMDSLAMNLSALQNLHAVQPFKCVIVDECHSFKEDDSKRTQALIKFLSGRKDVDKRKTSAGPSAQITGSYTINYQPITKRIFLSGTAIKNRASEYFVTLNLLRPKEFPSRQRFNYNYLMRNAKGVYDRLHPYRISQFHEVTKSFILRREKRDVLKDLPPFTRHFDFITVDSTEMKAAYNQELGLMENMMRTEKLSSLQLLGWLTKMRHLTGMAKIPAAIEHIEKFFENSELEKLIDPAYPDKIAIGVHHKGVREAIVDICKSNYPDYNVMSLSGSDNTLGKTQIAIKWNDPSYKILVANELAGGVGLNLQSCSYTLCVERQWSPADEAQWEGRFDRNGQKYPVTAWYLIADKTVDLFFHEMVEEKRKILGDTLSGWSFTSDESAIKSLVQRTLDNRL